MRFLLFIVCVAFSVAWVGCASHDHHGHSKKDPKDRYPDAIKQVLEARQNIRAVISHVPANPDELAGVANMDPNVLIFSARDFTQRLQTIPLTDCPQDFKEAFLNYVTAWRERSAADPGLLLLLNATNPASSGKEPAVSAQGTESAWQVVQAVCTKYGVAVN